MRVVLMMIVAAMSAVIVAAVTAMVVAAVTAMVVAAVIAVLSLFGRCIFLIRHIEPPC